MANESDLDRMVRAANAVGEAQQHHRREVLAFLEGAIDHAVGYVAVPICNGLKRSVGNTTPTEPRPARRGCRTFAIWGTHAATDIRVDLEVHVDGFPQIINDPRGVLYQIHIDGLVSRNGKPRKRFSIVPAENRTGRPIPTEQSIAKVINRNVADVLGISGR